MAGFTYRFEWDPIKARDNSAKHGVSFDEAAAVFRDPLALTVFDEAHSEGEDRWATLGKSTTGPLLVVIHTFRHDAPDAAAIRIISARPATKREMATYREEQR